MLTIIKNGFRIVIGIFAIILIVKSISVLTGEQKIQEIDSNSNLSSIPSTSGAIVEFNTGSILIGTGSSGPKEPEEIRLYLDYILKYGEPSVDYIVGDPIKQPNISSTNAQANNALLHTYIARNRISFTIPKTEKKGYVIFITHTPVAKNRQFFFGLNGDTIGWFNRDKSIKTFNSNEYMYELDSVALLGNNSYSFNKNLYNEIQNNILKINAFVGEEGNYVEKIIIFFK